MESTGKTIIVNGRIIWTAGDLFTGAVQNIFGTKQPKLNQQGEQVKEYGFGLAIDRNLLFPNGQLAPNTLWTVLHEEAQALYPSGQFPPGFAFKYKDGDRDADQNGAPLSQKAGYKGHIVFTCKTQIPIKFFRWEDAAKSNVLVNDGIFCGDHVQVQLAVKAHGPIGQGKPGVYINPMAVLLVQTGERIINAPSGDDIFGAQAPAGMNYAPRTPPGGGLMGAPGVNHGMPPMQQPAQHHWGAVPQHLHPPVAQPMHGMPPVQQAPQYPGVPMPFAPR